MRNNTQVVFFLFFLIPVLTVTAESVTVINNTGENITVIQAASAGSEYWGSDLIPDRVLLNGESLILDLIGDSPWSFRMVGESTDTYILYDVDISSSGKLIVSVENLAKLAAIAGPERIITITNSTGRTLTSLKISSISDSSWGNNLLEGKYLRDGETAEINFMTVSGSLSFDMFFTLLSGNNETGYIKNGLILTDGASIILTGVGSSG